MHIAKVFVLITPTACLELRNSQHRLEQRNGTARLGGVEGSCGWFHTGPFADVVVCVSTDLHKAENETTFVCCSHITSYYFIGKSSYVGGRL